MVHTLLWNKFYWKKTSFYPVLLKSTHLWSIINNFNFKSLPYPCMGKEEIILQRTCKSQHILFKKVSQNLTHTLDLKCLSHNY